MPYEFSFESTHQDLLDAYEAERGLRTGMSPWSRGLVLVLGAGWIAGFLVLGPRVFKESPAVPFVWLGLGLLIVWFVGLRPYLEKRRIRESNEARQSVVVSFGEEIASAATDGRRFSRSWRELAGVETAKLGVLLGFDDGMRNWIPNRAFRGTDEKRAFVDYVIAKLREFEEPENVNS